LGAFTGQADIGPSKGPGVSKILGEEVRKLGIEVRKDATFEVTMDYRVTVDKERSAVEGYDTPQILLSLTIINKRTGSRCLIAASVREQSDLPTDAFAALVCELFGIDRDDPGAGETGRRFAEWYWRRIKQIRKAVEEYENRTREGKRPRTFQRKGPYRVEILVRKEHDYLKMPLEDHGAMAFVNLRRGDEYVIKLINDSKHDAAVTLTIDGLNVFTFSQYDYRHFIVPKNGSLLVKGWHRSNECSEAFVITRYSESKAAKELSNPSDEVGTITAQFAAAWTSDEDEPIDEKGKAKSPSGIATGGRRSTPSRFKEVQRYVGRTRATVNIRYTKPMIAAPYPAKNVEVRRAEDVDHGKPA